MKAIIYILIFFAIYLVFALAGLQYYSVDEEIAYQMAGTTLNDTGTPIYVTGKLALWHAPLYIYILALLFKLLGSLKIIGSIVGIICFFLMLILIYRISRQLNANVKQARTIGLLACFIYCLHPLVIQGSLVLEIDNTILVVLMSLFLLCYLKSLNNPQLHRSLLLGALFAVVLWAKMTTPIILILSILSFHFLNKDIKRMFTELITIFFSGFLFFSISWWIISQLNGLDFNHPFLHIKDALIVSNIQGDLKSILYSISNRLGRITLWFSPIFIISGLWAIFSRVKEFLKNKKVLPVDLLIIYCALIFIIYTFVGGICWGFAKYQYPIVPILSIIISSFLYKKCMNLNKKKIYSYILFGLLALFYYVFIVGDPIYSVNYILKIALYEQSPKTLSIINSIAVQLFLYLLPVLALFIYIRLQKDRNRRHEVMALSLITLIISSNLALNVLQFNKDYNLAYNYGESRKDQVILYLQKILKKDDLVLGPLDIVYYVTDNYSGIFLSSGLLKRPRDIETLLSNQAACVVYGRNSFNKDTYQKIINSSWFQDQLHSKFIPTQIGTYTIWMRRVSKKQRE